MKRFFLGSVVGIALTIILGFSVIRYTPSYSTSEVLKIDGLFIFSDSKPVMPHDSLGVVDLGFVSGTQYETVRNNLLKRAKRAYPNADGIILNLNKKGLDNYYVIKFK